MLLKSYLSTQEFDGRNKEKTTKIVLVTPLTYISEGIASHDLSQAFLRGMPVHVALRWIQWH
jgi:hypothetical protein